MRDVVALIQLCVNCSPVIIGWRCLLRDTRTVGVVPLMRTSIFCFLILFYFFSCLKMFLLLFLIIFIFMFIYTIHVAFCVLCLLPICIQILCIAQNGPKVYQVLIKIINQSNTFQNHFVFCYSKHGFSRDLWNMFAWRTFGLGCMGWESLTLLNTNY